MPIAKPLILQKWVGDNSHLLKPPVGNQQVFKLNDDFIVIVGGGTNGRKDYHWEVGEELFYQLEGDIHLNIINEEGEKERVDIKEGDLFLLPPRIPHSLQRPANTVGPIIERYRKNIEFDKLMCFCDNCSKILHESTFQLEDIVNQHKKAIHAYMNEESLRTCKHCGTIMEKQL